MPGECNPPSAAWRGAASNHGAPPLGETAAVAPCPDPYGRRCLSARVERNVIDPQPFSEDEDRATEFGLSPVSVTPGGEPVYFGLAGTNSTDGREIIGLFQPDKEEFLEYDVASLIYRLSNAKRATDRTQVC